MFIYIGEKAKYLQIESAFMTVETMLERNTTTKVSNNKLFLQDLHYKFIKCLYIVLLFYS